MRSQTSTEYLIIVGVGVVLALLAAAGIFVSANITKSEINNLKTVKEAVIGSLR